jgi:hypothetical protein
MDSENFDKAPIDVNDVRRRWFELRDEVERVRTALDDLVKVNKSIKETLTRINAEIRLLERKHDRLRNTAIALEKDIELCVQFGYYKVDKVKEEIAKIEHEQKMEDAENQEGDYDEDPENQEGDYDEDPENQEGDYDEDPENQEGDYEKDPENQEGDYEKGVDNSTGEGDYEKGVGKKKKKKR